MILTNSGKQAEKRQKGFTLIELLAVFVILAVLAGIAVPFIGGILENARLDATRSTAVNFYEASRLYLIGENKEFKNAEVTVSDMVDAGYISEPLKDGWGKVIKKGDSKVKYDQDGQVDTVTIVSEEDKSTIEYKFKSDATKDEKDKNEYKLFK